MCQRKVVGKGGNSIIALLFFLTSVFRWGG